MYTYINRLLKALMGTRWPRYFKSGPASSDPSPHTVSWIIGQAAGLHPKALFVPSVLSRDNHQNLYHSSLKSRAVAGRVYQFRTQSLEDTVPLDWEPVAIPAVHYNRMIIKHLSFFS